ncbi:Glycogenin-1 [Mortierella claussenii]|nr:Glycogenin-1 [Mortierella claussenii]
MEAYITLLTNNSYASGAMVLGHSLRASQTTKKLAILITANVSRPIRDRIAQVYDAVIEIGAIDSHSTKNLELLGRPELGITLTKIHVFNQTQYSKVVFLDADTLVLRNIDELFDTAANGALDDKDRNKRFAASPDAGWPDCFNSGVFVCRPKYEDYTGLIEMAGQQGTFDGGDQGLLNSYFDGWSRGDSSNRLPFVYNTTPTSVYSYAPAFQQYKDKLAVIHFVGSFKPWQWLRFADGTVFPRNTSSSDSITLVQRWWNVFDKYVGGKPSDIHEVVHGYDLPPKSQYDHVGLDGQVHEPQIERGPHYEGWFQAYDHQGQKQQPPPPPAPVHHHQHHHEHHAHGDQQHHHHEQHQEYQEHQEHQGHGHEHQSGGQGQPAAHEDSYHEQWRPPIPLRLTERHHGNHHYHHHDHNQHQVAHHYQEHDGHQEHHEYHEHHEHNPHHAHNPHHLTDYHYQPPPPPPKIPELPEPGSHQYGDDSDVNGQGERQTHHRNGSAESTTDQETNPHHLTDYRYRLPAAADSAQAGGGGSIFTGIIPEPVGLPDMYYPNAWDLPEDPRKAHPPLAPTPLVIENTTNKDNTSVPSGKGRPVFPWETPSGPNTPKSLRAPTRTYYNYAASTEEHRRQQSEEEARRFEFEEAALEQIRLQEQARYEHERRKEEARERTSGSQAFEDFRLVNAWDVDRGVQLSILQKTEKRRPRSRKSSAGGIRKGYGLDDMLAYEARQRQEQYEAELVRKRLEEEERWAKEQEEARIKEEELRLEKIKLARLARIKAEQQQKQQEDGSLYVFRNAWDPPNVALTKKKLRIEDEEVELALPLRQDRRAAMSASRSGDAGAAGNGLVQVASETRAGHGTAKVAAAAAGAAGIAVATGNRSGRVQRSQDSASDSAIVGIAEHDVEAKTDRSKSIVRVTEENMSTASRAAAAGGSGGSSMALMEAHGTAYDASNKTTTNTSGSAVTTTTTKMTTPGSHRFVRTTVTTTITRRKFVNGKEVDSSTNTSSTGSEQMFEIPAGPRSGSYFGNEARRVVTISSSQEASRLTSGVSSSGAHSVQRTITSGPTEARTTSTSSNSEAHTKDTQHHEVAGTSSGLRKIGEKTTTTTTTRDLSRTGDETSSSEYTSSNVQTSSARFTASIERGLRKQQSAAMPLQIDTKSQTVGHDDDDEDSLEERQRRLDLREGNASAMAVAEAMEVLSKYPQATSRFATRPVSTSASASTHSATTSSNRYSMGSVLYANDPNLPRSSTIATASTVNKGKAFKIQAMRAAASSSDEDSLIYQDEGLEELEYFGERHTRAALPLGSPYMPSTPLASTSQRYAVSGFSSRAGSRPTTPGPGTPSRLGPGTPKLLSKRPFELKQVPDEMSSVQQTAPIDTGFSNYKIEWNWKELLGKKPRHWTAEEGEEFYDPYNALSTHGSLVDSDEDQHILESSSESDSDDEDTRSQHGKSGWEGGSGNGGSGSGSGFEATHGSSSTSLTSAFAAGEDADFTRESGFVIRGGKIARRRSSMALDRREL